MNPALCPGNLAIKKAAPWMGVVTIDSGWVIFEALMIIDREWSLCIYPLYGWSWMECYRWTGRQHLRKDGQIIWHSMAGDWNDTKTHYVGHLVTFTDDAMLCYESEIRLRLRWLWQPCLRWRRFYPAGGKEWWKPSWICFPHVLEAVRSW